MASGTNELEAVTTKNMSVLETDSQPFKDLNISENWKQLEFIKGRTTCISCKKSRKYFCYTCYKPVSEIKDIVPKIKVQ